MTETSGADTRRTKSIKVSKRDCHRVCDALDGLVEFPLVICEIDTGRLREVELDRDSDVLRAWLLGPARVQ
jgi:hypothetical protein